MAKKIVPIKKVAADELPNFGYEISAAQATALSKAGFQTWVTIREDGKREYWTN